MALLTKRNCILLMIISLLPLNGFATEATHYNRVKLQVNASQVISHDLMKVTLYTEEQNANPKKLNAQITKTLNTAIKKIKTNKDITLALGAHNSHPIYENKKNTIITWRERAELQLESKKFTELSSMIANLSGTLVVKSMQFAITDSAQKKYEKALIEKAISSFKEKADLITQSLGKKSYKLVSMQLNSRLNYAPMLGVSRMPSTYSRLKNNSSITPKIEAGTSKITLQASGTIEVQ